MAKTSKTERNDRSLPFPAPAVGRLRSRQSGCKKRLAERQTTTLHFDTRHPSRPFEIELADPCQRPLELGDLLSLHFAKRNIAFLSSLAFHLALLSGLSLLLIQAGFGRQMITLELTIPKPIEQEKELTFAPSADDEKADISPDDSDPLNDAANILEEESPEEAVTETKSGAGTKAGEKTSGTQAQFFGTEVKGDSFVYVIDRSRSMNNNEIFSRYDAATSEVIRSIDRLGADQKFHVLLFSNTTTPMFEDSSYVQPDSNFQPELVSATAENKQRLKAWLKQTEAGGGTDPAGSLSLAFDMNPDAVFMLSDGQFGANVPGSSGDAMKLVKRQNNDHVNIHTIAFDSEESKRNMREIASVSGGEYRFVTLTESILTLMAGFDAAQRLKVYKNWDKLGQITWQRRLGLARAAVKDLDSYDARLRDSASAILHHLSFNLYSKDSIITDSGLNLDFTLDDSPALIERWKTIWDQADSIQQQTEFDASKIESNLSEVILVAYGDFGNQQRQIHRLSAQLENSADTTDKIEEFKKKIKKLRLEHANSHVLVSLLSPNVSKQRKALTMITNDYSEIQDQICRTWDAKYKFATGDLIPLLKSPEKKIRELAEKSLHRISFGVFVGHIPTVILGDEHRYSREVDDTIDRWHDKWNLANTHYESKDPLANENLFDKGNEAKLLAYLSDIQRHKTIDELLAFGNSKMGNSKMGNSKMGNSKLSMDQQIWLARIISNFQSDVHISDESIALLRKLCNNIHKEHSNRKTYWDNQTQPSVWQKRFETAIRRRKSDSRRIFIRWKKADTVETKSKLGQRIIERYPETEYATTVRNGTQ